MCRHGWDWRIYGSCPMCGGDSRARFTRTGPLAKGRVCLPLSLEGKGLGIGWVCRLLRQALRLAIKCPDGLGSVSLREQSTEGHSNIHS